MEENVASATDKQGPGIGDIITAIGIMNCYVKRREEIN
jgi:hypothetical protein